MKNSKMLNHSFLNNVFQFQTVATDKLIPYYEVK